MYRAAPGKNIEPRSATAITEIEPGMPSAVSRVPSSGSTATSTSGTEPGADPLVVEEHRRFVLLALADHDDALHRHGIDHAAHQVDGGAVGGVLVAAADPARGAHGGRLGHPHELECEVAIGHGGVVVRAHASVDPTPATDSLTRAFGWLERDDAELRRRRRGRARRGLAGKVSRRGAPRPAARPTRARER